MLFASMIGGLGTIEGPILGCIIYFVLQQTLQNYGAWYLIIFGALAVAVAIWQPRGIWGFVRDTFHFELLPVGYRVRAPGVSTNVTGDGPAIRLWHSAKEEPPSEPDAAGAD